MISNDLTLLTENASGAYQQSLLFKKTKEGGAPENLSRGVVLEAEAPEIPFSEKPKPNTIPFRPGFLFEYFGEGGKISIAVTAREHIRVTHDGADMADPRKKALRSLVMLALGKLDAPSWNHWRENEKLPVDLVKKELSAMGIQPALPFGLGESSFLFTEEESLKSYTPLDVTG